VSYLHWLVVISIGFVVVEQLLPWRKKQPLLREGWLRDLLFVAFNGHGFAVLTGGLTGWVAVRAHELASQAGLGLGATPIAHWGFPAQVVAFLVVSDFLQWCIHVLLHRIPILWTFHKVHHSITVMDWAGNFRFHWLEILVYKSLQWLPLAWLGAPERVVLAVAVFSTVWGNLNHSNVNVRLGPLRYVLNNPRMHLWHHDVSDEGGVAKNFGIVLSLWDWSFGTVFWPRDRNPGGLGYPGMQEMPAHFPGQVFWPLTRRR
jgi:sterol desaturase/sphingolipid hydroxylase (fatty acid hydroxylase superfamily)